MKKTLSKIFLVYSLIWIALCCVFGEYKASSDDFNEIGFPFVFYREYNGKCIECEQLNTGFITLGLTADLGLIFMLSIMAFYYAWYGRLK